MSPGVSGTPIAPGEPQPACWGAGVAYLAMLQRTFPDNLSLVLAAYNAGPQTVVQAGYSVPPIAETQRYVDCVLQAQDTYRQIGLVPAFPRLRARSDRPKVRGPLRVLPLRLSRSVARQGKLITVQLEASHSSPKRVQGQVMLYYPAHLVSLAALHSSAGETAAAFPASAVGQATPADATAAYQLLQTAWSAWKPGEQRRAMIAVIPRVHQDLMLYLSVVRNVYASPWERGHPGRCRAGETPALPGKASGTPGREEVHEA